MSYSWKRINKGAKLHLQNFVGLARSLLKKYYQITIIWYAKVAPTRRKCFIGWECVSSHPANHQLTYESSHKNINPIPKWALITTICMREHGSMIINNQFLTMEIMVKRSPTRTKIQYSLTCQRGEMRNTPGTTHECSPEIFPPTDETSDVADTYTHVEPNVGTNSEQPEHSPTNPRSSKYNLRHKPKPNCNDDYRY